MDGERWEARVTQREPRAHGSARIADGRFAAIDAMVCDGLGLLYPGAVLMIAGPDRIAHAAAFGHAQAFAIDENDAPRPLAAPPAMRTDTIFDLASITKVAATTVAIMRLVEDRRLALDDTLAVLLPGFAGTDKAGITVRHLLAHRAGLWEWQPLWLHGAGPSAVLDHLAALPLRYPIGARHAYSDLGFVLLGAIVAHVAGMPLDRFVRDRLHRPLGMIDTGFDPAPAVYPRCAATSPGDRYQRRMAETGDPFPAGPILPPAGVDIAYRGHVLRGEVNDANAALACGGVAGHAGLFGTAGDLLRLAQALIVADPIVASRATLDAFEAAPFDSDQALGMRVYGTGRHTFFGHTGFTGTFFAYSRALRASVVLLTNRVHRGDRDDEPPPVLTALHDRLLAAVCAALPPVRSMTMRPRQDRAGTCDG